MHGEAVRDRRCHPAGECQGCWLGGGGRFCVGCWAERWRGVGSDSRAHIQNGWWAQPTLRPGNHIRNEELGEDAQQYIAENKKKYVWSEVHLEVVEGKKEYHVTALALTKEEWDARRDTIGK